MYTRFINYKDCQFNLRLKDSPSSRWSLLEGHETARKILRGETRNEIGTWDGRKGEKRGPSWQILRGKSETAQDSLISRLVSPLRAPIALLWSRHAYYSDQIKDTGCPTSPRPLVKPRLRRWDIVSIKAKCLGIPGSRASKYTRLFRHCFQQIRSIPILNACLGISLHWLCR